MQICLIMYRNYCFEPDYFFGVVRPDGSGDQRQVWDDDLSEIKGPDDGVSDRDLFDPAEIIIFFVVDRDDIPEFKLFVS